MITTRKQFLAAFAAAFGLHAAPPAQPLEMTVYKTKTCGCCGKWVEHVRAAGIKVVVNDVPNTDPYRRQFSIPDKFSSCHTALIGGYAVEGHVPVADIQRMLKEKPKGRGLVLPGMPMGSPGMEGHRKDAYAVLFLDVNGNSTVYRRYAGD